MIVKEILKDKRECITNMDSFIYLAPFPTNRFLIDSGNLYQYTTKKVCLFVFYASNSCESQRHQTFRDISLSPEERLEGWHPSPGKDWKAWVISHLAMISSYFFLTVTHCVIQLSLVFLQDWRKVVIASTRPREWERNRFGVFSRGIDELVFTHFPEFSDVHH